MHDIGGADVSTVDDQRRARDPACRIRCEENARISDILDSAETLERARPQHHVLDFLVGPDTRGRAFGRDRPGRNTVDANSVAAPFTRMRFGQLDNAGLRRRIRQHSRRAMDAGGRGQVDDAAADLLLDKLTRRRLRTKERAVKVDRDYRAPSVGREVEARRRDTAAVIVDHDVEAAKALDRLGDHLVALSGVAHVNDEHLAFAALLADIVAHGFEMLGTAARDHHRRATLGEFMGDPDTDSGAAAGHDCHFAFNAENVFQVFHLSVFFTFPCGSVVAAPSLSHRRREGQPVFTFPFFTFPSGSVVAAPGARANRSRAGANSASYGGGGSGVAWREWRRAAGAATTEPHGKVKNTER